MHQMSSTTEITMRLFIAAVLAGSVLAVSGMASMQPALAEKSSDKKGGDDKKSDDGHSKKIDPNMDIKNAYRDGTNLVMKVKGTAGGTVPAKPAAGHLGQVFVYAFVTDAGIMVINAHWECHVLSGCDPTEQHVSEWHAEFVTLGHVAGHEKDCVTSIYGERTATVSGHNAIVNTPEAHKILKAQTAAFNLMMDPDTAPTSPSGVCVAEFDHQFDVWTPKTNGDNEQSDD